MEFKKKYPFHERINESTNILLSYPDKVPVICEKDIRVQNYNITKKKIFSS